MPLLPGLVGSTASAQVGSGGDPYWNSVILLANFDSGSVLNADIDASGNTASVARSNSAITVQNTSPADTPYSYYLNKTSGNYYYRIFPSDQSVWSFSGPFTFEFWINAVSISNNGYMISNRSDNTSNFGYELQCNSSGILTFNLGFGTGGSSLNTGINKSSLTGTWAHVALTRDGSDVVRSYLNGSVVNSATISGTTYQSTQPMWIYASGRGLTGWYGALDEIRVTKSVARYTGSSFTVPSAPFPTS
ncbi:MAG: LamG domain-containing protein [Gammaproteobacteria bacterium]|nr:LamG domain-containing protein [Gammaproteobacteria bacterium]